MVVIIWWLGLQLPMQSVPSTTEVVSSNLAQARFTQNNNIAAGRWFTPDTLISSTNKTDCHDITEILLKVALNTITIIIHLMVVVTNVISDLCHVDGFLRVLPFPPPIKLAAMI